MILLDTDVISELMRAAPDAAVVRWMDAQPLDALHITSLSCAEILLGIALLPDGKRRQRLAEQAAAMFAEDFFGRILGFEFAAAPACAAILGARQRAGQRLSPVDGMIAAIAHLHGAIIATRDGDLADCGVPVVNPWRAG